MLSKLPEPLNAEERLLHGICERLDILIELTKPKVEEVEEPIEDQITIEEYQEEIKKDYDSMDKKELISLLEERNVEFDKRKGVKSLADLARETE